MKEIIIAKKLSPLAEQAKSLFIIDDKSLKTGVELLSTLNKYNDSITEEKEKVTKPLNEALKAERARWKPAETMYDSAITLLRSKMSYYQTELVRAKQIAEQKIAERVGKGTLKIETGIKKLESMDVIEKEHATDVGLVQFREKKQIKILDESLIPREYLMINEEHILEDLKKDNKIPGVELETIQIAVNFR